MNLYQQCEALFHAYPDALHVTTGPGEQREWHGDMVLTRATDAGSDFYRLYFSLTERLDEFWLRRMKSRGGLLIAPDAAGPPDGITPGEAAQILGDAVPVPAHGSLFGLAAFGVVTTLIPVWSRIDYGHPEPSYAVMTAGPVALMPPETFGNWFWDWPPSPIVNLRDAVASNPGSFFWVRPSDLSADPALGVASPVTLPTGETIHARYYTYCEPGGKVAVPDGMFPPLSELPRLAQDVEDERDIIAPGEVVDLAPRFKRAALEAAAARAWKPRRARLEAPAS